MKASVYNNFIPFENKIIGYSGLSNQYIIIEPDLYQVFETAIQNKHLTSLSETHPELYKLLIQHEFIIEDTINELQVCLDNFLALDNQDTNYQLFINPTMNCNFKCWYCYESHIKDSKINPEVKANIIKFVVKTLEEKKSLQSFHISWFGGEPLLYFHKLVVPIMENTKTLCHQHNIRFNASITTNGLLVNDKVIHSCKDNGLLHFQITLDGHRERHNQVRFISESKGSYDSIISNIKNLVRHKIVVNVRINCSKETFEGLEHIASDFSDIEEAYRDFLKFDFHSVWQVEESLDKEMDTFIELFRSKGFRVIAQGMNAIRNSCYADKKNHVTINYNGEVFKCTARDFTTANSEGKLTDDGAVIWNEKYEKRFNLKYKNKPCLKCSIFPICGGGCSQQTLENEGKDYCVYGYDTDKKKQIVLNRFLATL